MWYNKQYKFTIIKNFIKRKNVLLGVSGGIACYKACLLVNSLKREGMTVKVIMTEAATKFVAPLTFQALSENPVYLDMFSLVEQANIEHISLTKWADIMVIAPATANTISKIANAFADNMLTTVMLALRETTPVVIAPAMNTSMWTNELLQDNIKKLKKIKIGNKSKYNFIGPKKGVLACGDTGEGALIQIDDIIGIIKKLNTK